MVKRPGHPPRLVNKYAENWPITEINQLPHMRGVYVLYDRRHHAFYCGIAGKGRSNARSRIRHHLRERYLGAKIRYFSVYDVNRGLMRQVETLILHALGRKQVLRWNTHKGRFLKTAKKIRLKRTSRSDAAKKAWRTRKKNNS